MIHKFILLSLILTCSLIMVRSQDAKPPSDEDKRCKCVCPSLAAVLNNSTAGSDRLFYVENVNLSDCNCEYMVLPHIENNIGEKKQEFCLQCECKYENRNTTIIKVVVIIVIWIIMLLVVYMGFLICLDPLINKRAKAGSYQEHTNEEDESSVGGPAQPMGVRGNVLNRVTHQQDKWKRQVREQRRNIYDRHTMLN